VLRCPRHRGPLTVTFVDRSDGTGGRSWAQVTESGAGDGGTQRRKTTNFEGGECSVANKPFARPRGTWLPMGRQVAGRPKTRRGTAGHQNARDLEELRTCDTLCPVPEFSVSGTSDGDRSRSPEGLAAPRDGSNHLHRGHPRGTGREAGGSRVLPLRDRFDPVPRDSWRGSGEDMHPRIHAGGHPVFPARGPPGAGWPKAEGARDHRGDRKTSSAVKHLPLSLPTFARHQT